MSVTDEQQRRAARGGNGAASTQTVPAGTTTEAPAPPARPAPLTAGATDGAAPAGRAEARPAAPTATAPPRGIVVPRRVRGGTGSTVRLLALAILAVVIVGAGATVGYRYYYDSTHFVSTDNAQISGNLIQVGALAAGRVSDVQYDIGQHVQRGDVVATVLVPIPVSTTQNGTPRIEFRNTEDAKVEATSPVSGVVVARGANPGDTVPAGQPILTVVDPKQLWVNANIEETQIRWVRSGQPVTIHVDALNADVSGHVVAIRPASAATFSLLPSQNVSGNFTKETQLVPVKIAFDQPSTNLMIGTSVEVSIRIED